MNWHPVRDAYQAKGPTTSHLGDRNKSENLVSIKHSANDRSQQLKVPVLFS